MPRTWIGWIALIVVIVLIWKHPDSVGHFINGAINRIDIMINSL